jgi:AraC-like DNA-binding protein
MNKVKLDRLSALLEGLAPQVTLSIHPRMPMSSQPVTAHCLALRIYLVIRGAVKLKTPAKTHHLESPVLLALRSDQPHELQMGSVGDQSRVICALVLLSGPVAALFLEEFAQMRSLPLSEDEPAIRLAVQMIEAELNEPRCGQPALLDRAGDILFIGLLRHLVAHPGDHRHGLFSGLADARIARALVAMHQRPSFDWDLESLALQAGMSRTAFAARFREVMQKTPGKYLGAIRIAMAQRAVDLGKGLKEAARIAGYTNTSALSRALSKNRLQTAQA